MEKLLSKVHHRHGEALLMIWDCFYLPTAVLKSQVPILPRRTVKYRVKIISDDC